MDILKLAIGLFSCHYLYGRCLWCLALVPACFSGVKMEKGIGKKPTFDY